jgi:membrane protein DedA with SNARE-associated domain
MDKLLDIALSLPGPASYLIILGILLACGLGLPIPEDITLFAAGVFAYFGIAELGKMIAVALFGVIVGDSIVFFLGRRYGRKLTRVWFFHKLLPDERMELVAKKFQERGNKLIFAARFMPGLRAPIFFSAGTLHLPYRVFLFYDGGAALLSVPAIIGAVYYYGDDLERVIQKIQKIEHGLVAVIFGTIGILLLKWYLGRRRMLKDELKNVEQPLEQDK